MTTKRHVDACPGGCGAILLERLRGSGAACQRCDPSERGRARRMTNGVYWCERAAILEACVCRGNGRDECSASVDNPGDVCSSCLDDLACTNLGDGGVVAPEDRALVDVLFPTRRETIIRATDGTPVEVRPLF